MSEYKGACHCKQVEWTVKLGSAQHVLCHCQACKTVSGSAFTLNQIVDKSEFDVTKGEDQIKCYTYQGDSGNKVHCFFCGNCSAHVYHHQEVMGPDRYVVRTATLEGSNAWKPVLEIYGKERVEWLPEVAQTIPAAPPM